MTMIKVKSFFDDEKNIKWKTAFMSEKEEITIFKDSIRIWNNRYDSDDNFYELKDRIKTLDRESRLLKVAYKKWKLEFGKNKLNKKTCKKTYHQN